MSDGDLFRQAFRWHVAQVVVLMYLDSEASPCGMTATTMCSLSADPPSLLVCINRESRAHTEITARGRFGVNLSSIDQRLTDTSYAAYSHSVFLGLLEPVWLNPRDAPLPLYHGGIYSQLESPVEREERFRWELRED